MSKSAIQLEVNELENVYIFNPFWDFIANNCYPDWLAPNVITLLGLIVPMVSLVAVAYLFPTLTGVFPPWLLALNAFALFWYSTLDATDGKQARRTDNCSPLGQILDHNLDQLT